MGEPAYNYADDDYDLPPDEDLAADEAAEQTTRLTVIEGGEGAAVDTAAAGATDAAAAGAADTAAAGATETAVGTGIGATLAAGAAFILILFWPSDIAPEPRASAPHAPPKPAPKPATPPSCPADPCPDLLQDIRDAIDRDKRNFGNKGMHGVLSRWQELINGPCGPGQMPYRINSRGEYVKQDVWQNHVDEFQSTKRALRNRFDRAIDSGCAIPDDLVNDAAKAGGLDPPDPSKWVGDPTRPCTDSIPPDDWNGPPEPPASRGL